MPGRPDATAPSQFFNVSTFFESIAAGKAWPRKAELTEVSIAKAGAGLAELGPADASRKGFALVGRQKPMSRNDCTQGNATQRSARVQYPLPTGQLESKIICWHVGSVRKFDNVFLLIRFVCFGSFCL